MLGLMPPFSYTVFRRCSLQVFFCFWRICLLPEQDGLRLQTAPLTGVRCTTACHAQRLTRPRLSLMPKGSSSKLSNACVSPLIKRQRLRAASWPSGIAGFAAFCAPVSAMSPTAKTLSRGPSACNEGLTEMKPLGVSLTHGCSHSELAFCPTDRICAILSMTSFQVKKFDTPQNESVWHRRLQR